MNASSATQSNDPMHPVSGSSIPRACRLPAESSILRVVEERDLEVYCIRVSPVATVDAISRLVASLNCELPFKANTFLGDSSSSLAYVEPRAWLLLGTDLPRHPEVGGRWIVTDVSARYTVFRLSGSRAADLLARALAVVPEPGGIIRSLFAETMAIFVQCLASDDYRLLVAAPAADFVANWIRDAVAFAI